MTIATQEPAFGHVALKKAAVNWAGNAQQTDADGGLGLTWGRGGGPQHQGTVGSRNAEKRSRGTRTGLYSYGLIQGKEEKFG